MTCCRMLLLLLLLLLWSAAAWAGPTPCHVRDGEALLGALLPLHRGPACGTASLRGAQLEAGLRAALDRVNRDLRREAISISVRILDTCSEPDEAVKAAMRALVASDQTCLHPPLFLGLLGPEDPRSLDAALKVTAVFETVHVVPWGAGANPPHVLHVAKMDAEERAKGAMLLLRRLRWPTFLLVHGEDPGSSAAAAALLRLADADPEICAQRRVHALAHDGRGDSDVAWAISKDSSGGVVMLVDSAERAAGVLGRLAGLSRTGPGSEVHVLLAVRQTEAAAGTGPAASAPTANLSSLRGVTITMLHEVSPSSLVPPAQRALLVDSPLWHQVVDSALHAQPDAMEDSQDAAVGALAVAVQLVGAALRAAHRIKCPPGAEPGAAAAAAPPPPPIFCPALHAMAPDEWRSILERVTAFPDAAGLASGRAGAPAKLRFGMELRSAARVLVKRSNADYFEKAGLLVGGRDLQLDSSRFAFPPGRDKVDQDCGAPAKATGSSSVATFATSAPPKSNKPLERYPRTTPAPQAGSDSGLDWSWILGGSYEGSWEGDDFWHMVYMLAGAGALMLLVFTLCFYIVYRSFRVKVNRGDDNDSNSSPKSRTSRRSSGS